MVNLASGTRASLRFARETNGALGTKNTTPPALTAPHTSLVVAAGDTDESVFTLTASTAAAQGIVPGQTVRTALFSVNPVNNGDWKVKSVSGADVIYTDVWASMGEKDKADEKAEKLEPFQINQKLLKHAKDSAIVMHCLPAERGREITDDVMDGPQSVVFDQAENRLHIQKAIMVFLMKWVIE